MKKLYSLFITMVVGTSGFAQTVTSGDMENWRSGNSGTSPVIPIHAPLQWYGVDSLMVAAEEAYLPVFFAGYMPTDLHTQLWQENTVKHGGSSSAKLMTLKQDTLGMVAGVLSNGKPNLDITAMSYQFSGGQQIAGRLSSVSAWVRYSRGKDSTGAIGLDSGMLSVTVYSHILGIDSAVGTGTVNIGPSDTFQQITANIVYTDSLDGADTVRILFASSGQTDISDSSTLYVDDVTMTYVPTLNVKSMNATAVINVYPNPASGMLYLDGNGTEGAVFQLYSVSGQLVATKMLATKDAVDISTLPEGLYMYTITDQGNAIQRGKVSVVK